MYFASWLSNVMAFLDCSYEKHFSVLPCCSVLTRWREMFYALMGMYTIHSLRTNIVNSGLSYESMAHCTKQRK